MAKKARTILQHAVPLLIYVPQNLFFHVPDEQLQTVRDAAAKLDLYPADDTTMPPAYGCEYATGAVRFDVHDHNLWHNKLRLGPTQRLVFVPLSWSRLRPSEAFPINSGAPEIQFEPRTPRTARIPKMPSNVLTIPIAATCATLIRIASREPILGPIRIELRVDLSGIIGYCLLDMSYEGDYMEFPSNDVPLSTKELADIQHASDQIQGWAFRDDEEWMRELLLQIVSGKKDYSDLPSRKSDERVGVLETVDQSV